MCAGRHGSVGANFDVEERPYEFYQPIDSSITPRFAGPATFMRLPIVSDARETDIAMIKRLHGVTRVSPFELCRIADFGDSPTTPIDLMRSLETISAFARSVVEAGATPLAVGGDHLSSLPLLRGFKDKGPLALIHFDAHHDMDNTYFSGLKYTHGTPFRRAIEEGLIDPNVSFKLGYGVRLLTLTKRIGLLNRACELSGLRKWINWEFKAFLVKFTGS